MTSGTTAAAEHPGRAGKIASEPGEACEAAMRREFAVRTETFCHRDLHIEMLLPLSADALIDEAEFDRDERLPYWADLWPAARALARHLWDEPHMPRSALELGCGLALPALALLARGARVLATDYHADAFRFARANAVRNGLPMLRTRLLDWRVPPPDLGVFDLVIAADVMYERRNAAALVDLLPKVVAAGGRVLIADPGRVYMETFVEQMQQNGWQVRERGRFSEPTGSRAGTQSRIRLVELRR